MIKLSIAAKTFNLYKKGKRTFIHLSKEDTQITIIRNLKYGDELILVNQETMEELAQIFWFRYDFAEFPRFVFLAFQWARIDQLFTLRKMEAERALENAILNFNYISFSENYNWVLFHQALAYSSFLFVTDSFVDQGRVIIHGYHSGNIERESSDFIVLEEILKIKKNVGEKDQEDTWQVISLFPINLLYLQD